MTEKKRTYYTLKDKILRKRNMKIAEHEVFINKGSAGVDGVTVKEFRNNYKMNMLELRRQYMEDRYEAPPVLRVMIPKGDGRERPLGIPTVKDRIAQATVKRIMEQIFEKIFCDCSYGFRPGRSQIDAINKSRNTKNRDISGY